MTRDRSLGERDAAHLWHPYTQHGVDKEPLRIESAKGAVLQLADGRELIDGISSWWACLHGHGHPRLIEAMRTQAEHLDHVLFAGATHEPAVALAEELLAAAPRGLSRVFYSDNGSTAVEVALKMVVHRWVRAGERKRTVFLALEGSYHGDTFGAMSVGDPDPFFVPYAPLLFEVRRIPPEADALKEALEDVGARCAGVVLEPLIQGAAGMLTHPPEFLRAARSLCDDRELPLIVDEVFTGFGRTGRMFACEHAGVSPDLLCLSKGLTGGMLPLAATLATERIFESFLHNERGNFFPHGHTMTANPIGCAVARASLALCQEDDVPERLRLLGERLAHSLEDLKDSPRIAEMRVLGGVVALELRPQGGDTSGYLANVAPALRKAAIERGVLLRPLGNVLYTVPPACTSPDQADAIAQAMRELASLDV